jgi:hypothetical protein
VDGGGVPQVMQSWLIAAAVMTQHASPNSQSAEDVLCRVARHRGGSARQEQCCVQCGGVLLGTLGHIGPQGAGETGRSGGTRHRSWLMVPAVSCRICSLES